MCVKLVIYKNYNESYSRIQRNNISSALRKNRTQNEIWRNIDSNNRLFANDCIIYRKIKNKSNTEKLHKDLDTLGEWAVENGMKINPGKNKAMRFTRARVKRPLCYSLGDQKIPEASSCKCLGINTLGALTLYRQSPDRFI